MNKKIFLTSVIAMCIACPSFAESFPNDGYMKENKKYDNAAISDNMDGVYSGSVKAIAEYEISQYTIEAGYYLPADSEYTEPCDEENASGYFCAGSAEKVPYNANEAQGMTSCSDATSGAYTQSNGKGTDATSCYRACNIANMGNNGSIATIAHATALSGKDYYGSGIDACSPTSCENGWHAAAGINFAETFEYVMGEWAWIDDNGSFGSNSEAEEKDRSYYGITANNTWSIDFGEKGFMYGEGRCSSLESEQYAETHAATELGGDGGNCYCNVTGYKATAESDIRSVSSPWIYLWNVGDDCNSQCSYYCAMYFGYGDGEALDLMKIVGVLPGICEANTITINWSDYDDANIESKRSVTYGGDVVTPVKAQTKPGKRFTGWRFSKPTQQ